MLLTFPIFKIGSDGALYDNELVESTNEFSALTALISNVASWENRFVKECERIEEKFDGKIDEVNTQLSEKLNVEKNRIDSLTTLAEGSTTGDAELMDIRIGANGFIYDNSGSSVRHQISTINHAISEVSKKLMNYITLENNYRNGVGFDKNNGTNKVIDYTASILNQPLLML